VSRAVLFICATNHPSNIDPAIKSRLGDPIELPLPDTDTRRRIMQTALNGNELDMEEADWAAVTRATADKDGRWLAETLCREVACIVAREAGVSMELRAIKLADFESVLGMKGGGSTSAAASQQALPASGAPVAAPAVAAPPIAPLAAAGASQHAPPPTGALALAADSPGHAERVSACRRLFTRVPGSPHLFRHEVYAYIAKHECGEHGAWETVGTTEQRAKAVEDPRTLKRGSRPATSIVSAWTDAMAEAFHGFEFENNRGDGSGLPRGYSTTELAFNAV